jgi:LDH2 family malate/lactate/ureidoglycolate dehydrogenase
MAGVFVLAIDPGLFGAREHYAQMVADNLNALRAQEPARGFSAVVAPGELEARSRASRSREGIDIPEPVWKELVELAKRYGIEPP